MLTRAKQIVIDKDAFIGIRLDELCSFAERHIIVLSGALVYECATTDSVQPLRLIHRFEELAGIGLESVHQSRPSFDGRPSTYLRTVISRSIVEIARSTSA